MKPSKFLLLFLLSFCVLSNLNAQRGFGINSPINCGTDDVMKQALQKDPLINKLNAQIESRLLQYYNQANKEAPRSSVTILPVVVHLIHNNGAENISDARVLTGIQHLNEAFANTGYYDPLTGVNTNIQFCLAQRDPNGQGTTGITRNVSPYTNMGGPDYYSDDINVKNVNRWNPNCYINIWLVNSIPGPVAGYGTFPAAHGSNTDGILMEAEFFGSGYSNDVVIIHEIGHYLGLYHTFEQGCTNNNCASDGDRVCDTPPDNSTSVTSCNVTVNSCSSDALSGFATDQNDLTTDYLDYGNWDCMSVFTQGQSDRMNWHITNVRSSLLACNSCVSPCPNPITANFTKSSNAAPAGTTISFTNTSLNGATYSWYVNGILVSNTFNFSQVFTQPGTSIIRLVVGSSNPALCVNGEKIDSVMITCPARASFKPGYNGVSVIGNTVSFTNTSTGATSFEWYFDNSLVATSTNFSVTFNSLGNHYIKLRAKSQYCVDSTSVYYQVNAPPSSNISFQKRYQGVYSSSYLNIITPDQNIFTIGTDGTSIVKTTTSGSVIWAKSYAEVGSIYTPPKFTKVVYTNDGNLLLIASRYDMPFFIKIDLNGNVIWNKYINEPASAVLNDLVQLADGSFIVSGNFYYGYLIFFKISATGQVLWKKTLAYGNVEFNGASFVLVGNDVYFASTIYEIFGPHSPDGLLLKINPLTGAIVYGKRYDYRGKQFWFRKMRAVGSKLVIEGDFNNINPARNYNKVLALVDLDGAVQNFKRVHNYPNSYNFQQNFSLFVNSRSEIYLSVLDSGSLTPHIMAFDSSLSFIKGKTFPALNINVISPINEFSNGDYLIGASGNGPVLIRTLPELTRPTCTAVDFTPVNQTDTLSITDITSTLNYTTNFPHTESVLNMAAQNLNVTSTEECNFIPPPSCDTSICRTYKLSGLAQVCNAGDTIMVLLQKDNNCNFIPTWSVSGTAAYQVLSQLDTVIKLKASSEGRILVKVKSMSSCKIVEDSFLVRVNFSPSQINLGADIQLCNSSTIQLNAGGGFKSYIWQDGSVDSTFTVYLPGTYFVKAYDYCGHAFSDTITISTAPAVVFNIGDDKEICARDTITITAPPGFSNYKWSPNYAINDAYAQTVKLWPGRDTIYTVTAEKALGCSVLDSIRIKVHALRTIALGNDTSFCQGGSVNLNAGNNFISYLWNTGITTQSLVASVAGIYYVAATDMYSCISRDTLNVMEVFPNPVINLGFDKNLCRNSNIILNAGTGFQSYLWQDNSVNQTYTVMIPGQYWVKIINNNNCVSADTINILSVVPNPVIDLGADTSLCEGRSMILSAGPGFSIYTWQDNSHNQSHTASQPGQYWVTVTDNNGCSSNDTLRILAIFPKPAINIGRDTILCQGQFVRLNAGNGFAQYLWSDNTTGQFLAAGLRGIYWVKVSDNNGCTNADTMQVKDVSPLPGNFIQTVYSICANDKVFIKPVGRFNSYLWSNGSTSDSMLVSVPGKYWLTARNNYGCEARANFEVVTKECINAIYFPNSFTPNRDNLNEIFKPAIYGSIEQYHLEIFNRFGQRVFVTNDYLKGWNGVYNGMPQNAGVYIWISTFKLKEKPSQVQKGPLLLIR